MDHIVQWIAHTRQVNTRIAMVLSHDSEVLSRVQTGFHSSRFYKLGQAKHSGTFPLAVSTKNNQFTNSETPGRF